jgi:putative ABC transport system ATP-binding protein
VQKASIIIDNIHKQYDMEDEHVVALDNITTQIYKEEICSIVGPSGSGKSTLLNMMAGLEKPTSGKIVIDTTTVTSLTEKELALFRQQYIGFVFQSFNLLPMLTAVENVSLPLIFKGVSKAERLERSQKMLEQVGLGNRQAHRPNQMSGGQQQRVAIARAFVANPGIVFADEPTGNLDSHTSKEVMEMMQTIARQQQQTLIIVTHDENMSQYSDRVIRILDGNIEKIEITKHK